MSTRESMKGNTLLQYTTVTHHTHLQGPKGEESTGETQIGTVNKVSHWGRVQDEEEGYPHPLNLIDAPSEE